MSNKLDFEEPGYDGVHRGGYLPSKEVENKPQDTKYWQELWKGAVEAITELRTVILKLKAELKTERKAHEATRKALAALSGPIHLGYIYSSEEGITDIFILDENGDEIDTPVKATCLLERISKYFKRAKSAEQKLATLKAER